MSLNLSDITAAVQNYIGTQVQATVSPIRPATPPYLARGENFTFDITVSNAAASAGGLYLNRVFYYLKVHDPAVCSLLAPSLPELTAHSTAPGQALLAPDTLVPEMYLIPQNQTFLPGQVKTLNGLKGRGVSMGTTRVEVQVRAGVDMNALFPVIGGSYAITALTVSGGVTGPGG